MLFNSFMFILVFLPAALLGWYGLNRIRAYEWAKVFLAGMSLWFYAYFNVSYLFIILGSIGFNYLLSFLLDRAGRTGLPEKACRRFFLAAGLIFNLGLLFVFKYYDFFVENINAVFHADFNLKHILLPLGISFFTFQQLSFVIDRCLGRARHYSFINYVTFVTFFPQLIAGPIVLYKEMLPQFEDLDRRRFDADNFAKGTALFVLGLGKKVLLADVLALPANFGFQNTWFLDTPSTVLVILSYTLEIYFDFSGYCDMAIGIGRMFNIELPVNFNSPYKACSVKELWQRWHITLSRFFITYVYIPLGGSRRGKLRTVFNTMAVFALSGLWHGANWTFVAWGVLQGLLVVWDNLGLVGVDREGKREAGPGGETDADGREGREAGGAGEDGAEEKSRVSGRRPRICIPAWLGWLFTFGFFNLSLFFFRSDTMAGAVQMFRNLFSFRSTGYLPKVAATLDIPEFYLVKQALNLAAPELLNAAYLVLFVLILLVCALILTRRNAKEIVDGSSMGSGFCWKITAVFVWSLISLSQVSTFLYFNF